MKDKIKFYSGNKIRSTGADYLIIIGERSNGKTYDTLKQCLIDYYNNGDAAAYIRRWEEDIRGSSLYDTYSNIIANDEITTITKGTYNSLLLSNKRLYLVNYDDAGKIITQDTNPCVFAFALTQEEHYKSKGYDSIKRVIFDEFITRQMYLPDEFVKFQNLLSTIIRHKDDVYIYMLGNTINKYCPYFNEMGLNHIKNMKQGTIDIYKYGGNELTVAVEFSDMNGSKKASNKYFAFDNPKLNMIKGTNGVWEIGLYPHLPIKYNELEVVYHYYIVFNGDILEGEMINSNGDYFTFIHPKTTPIKENNFNLVFDTQPNHKTNYRLKLTKPKTLLERNILAHFTDGKVFYSSNDVGEIVRNYLQWCKETIF